MRKIVVIRNRETVKLATLQREGFKILWSNMGEIALISPNAESQVSK